MKYVLIFWGIPVGSLALWYGLSINDINLGSVYLSRPFNDLVFEIYGSILGIEGEQIRDSLMRILLVDSIFVFAVAYFKPFRRLKSWWVSYRARRAAASDDVEGLKSIADAQNERASYQDSELLPFNVKSLSNAP